MSEYSAQIVWRRAAGGPGAQSYSRSHVWRFDGGVEVAASASPQVVPPPYSSAAAVDPEEAFVASLSSCHMLWFLFIAAERGFVVEEYVDNAAGTMAPDAAGRLAMTHVVLRPRAAFSGQRPPTPEEIAAMHEKAHQECFIANSVKTAVHCVPQLEPAQHRR